MSRLGRNPFHVLGLATDCTPREVERAGQKLLAMLSVGFAGADEYPSPLGLRPRDVDLVRWATAELRDPQRRALHARWADLPTTEIPPADGRAQPWPEALQAVGWGAR